MKKKLTAVFMIIAMCMSFVSYSYAQTESNAQNIIDSISNLSPDEVQSVIEENADFLGLDLSMYNNLTSAQRNNVMKQIAGIKFESVQELKITFETACKKVVSSSKPSSGGGGGGGGGGRRYWQFDTYTVTRDCEAIYEDPENGTPVKFVVKAVYMGEPMITYAVAVYDGEEHLKSIAIHESETEKLYESEFFEVDTEYYDDYNIKLFKFESMANLRPLGNAEFVDFSFGMGKELPQKETEKDGVIAVKGNISKIYADGFELDVIDRRAYGYWGTPTLFEDTIRINSYCEALALYRDMHYNDVVYNIIENDDGTYELESIDVDGEIVLFAGSDVQSISESSITVMGENEMMTYQVSEQVNFRYEYIPDYEYTFAWIKEGVVQEVYPYNYTTAKVIASGGDKVQIGMYEYVSAELVSGEMPLKDDIVLEDANGMIRVINPVYGMFAEDSVIVGGNTYSLNYVSDCEELLAGEKCLVYFTPDKKHVKCVTKDYSAMQYVFVEAVNYDDVDDKVTLSSQFGEIVLSEYVYFDGIQIATTQMTDLLDCPGVLLMTDNGEYNIFRTPEMLYDDRGQYIKATETIAGYSIKNADIIAIVGNEIYTDFIIEEMRSYSVKLYSKTGTKVDLVVVRFSNKEELAKQKYMIVTEVNADGIKGYWNGEYSKYSGDFSDSIQLGDLVFVQALDDEVIDYGIINSAVEMNMYQNTCVANEYTFLPALDVTDNVIILRNGSSRRAYATHDDTIIYMYDQYSDTLEKAKLTDVFFNPIAESYYNTDRILIQTKDGVNADFIIIYK